MDWAKKYAAAITLIVVMSAALLFIIPMCLSSDNKERNEIAKIYTIAIFSLDAILIVALTIYVKWCIRDHQNAGENPTTPLLAGMKV